MFRVISFLVLLVASMQSLQAKPLLKPVSETLEAATIEILMAADANAGQLIARFPKCQRCEPATLLIDESSQGFLNEKPVARSVWRSWQGIEADVNFNPQTNVVNRIRRFQ